MLLRLDVGFAIGNGTWLGVLVAIVVILLLLRWTGTAEKTSTENQKCSSAKANVECSPKLPLLSTVDDGVVEVLDDGVGGPADWDETQDSSNDEGDATGNSHFDLFALILHKVGALASIDSQDHCEQADDDGDDDQSSGGLQILGQCQHGVIDLTLHLACTLHDTGHPQPLPDDLRRHNVGSDECCYLPHGKGANNDGPQEANDAQAKAQHLAAHGHHFSFF